MRLAARQERNFQRAMDLIVAGHPFYRRVLSDRGLRRDDFASLKDIRKLPITHKSDYVESPEAFLLVSERCPDLSLAERTVYEIVYTTGSTSGQPVPFYDTGYDHAARLAQLKEMASWCGIGPDDTVANLFPITAVPHQGVLTALYGPLTIGAKVIRGFTGRHDTPFDVYHSTAELAQLVERHRATVLWGITSFVRRLIVKAEELALDFSSVRLAFVAGEPCPPALREDIRRRLTELGAERPTIQNGYGFTEIQGPSIECRDDGPLHVPSASQYLIEIVDPESHEPVRAGHEGLVLVSHLNRRGTVLLRYAVGDVSAVSEGSCPVCGREGPRFVSKPRRVGDLIKVKGTLINPVSVINAVAALPGVEDFQIVVDFAAPEDPLSGDELVLRYLGGEDVTADIAAAVKGACEVTPRVVRAPRQEFDAVSGDYKFKRVLDKRGAAHADR
jgi:phenylacetate-CoA ligase